MRPPRGYQPQFALAELLEVDDSGKQQTVTHHGLAGEKHSEVYRPQPFGSTSVPPKGSTGVVGSLGGERNRSVFFAGEHDDYRPKNLKPGQKASYDLAGNITTWGGDSGVSTGVKKGDHATTVEKGKLAIDVKEKEISLKAKKDSKLEVTDGKMTVKAKGDVEVNTDGRVALGETTTNGNHSVKGLLSASRGLSTGALEVAPDEDGGLTEATMGLKVTGGASADIAKTDGYTVAELNAAYPPADNIGARAYVTDATSPTFLAPLVGGGTDICPAFCNGASWVAT